jgi:lipid-binding SYLF domain-containing protein
VSNSKEQIMRTATRFIVVASLVGAVAGSSHAQVVPLPTADQKILNQYLGKGVVGDAIAGETITDPSKFYPLRAATLSYRVTSGKDNGGTEKHVWTKLVGNQWQEAWGKDSSLTLHQADDGNIYMLIHGEGDEGIINKYSPPEPMVLKGMKPGDTRKSKSDVKVFDADKPDKLTHEGALDLTFTYVGAYRVTVPAGSYDAVLLKWQYTGKIGPAKVNDVQYRLLAAGIGTVAEIEKKKVSAMLLYHDDSKVGKVLLAAPGGAPPVAAAAREPINKRDREARDVIAKFKEKDPSLEKFFNDAAGWVVFPTIAKGGFIVGGARGDGVVYKNDEVIGYSVVSQGTIGLQIGGQTYSEIVFFQDEPALNHFKAGNAEFSAQASAVAVTAGASADAGYAEGVAIFTMAKGGAMLEASIGGQGFSFEEK